MYMQKNSDGTYYCETDNPLAITARRFPAIVGKSRYDTDFKIWAEMMRVYREKLTNNKYILAGKIIEPKVIQWLKMKDPRYLTPEEYYEQNRTNYISGDPKFGGKPDLLLIDNGKPASQGGKIIKVVEIKAAASLAGWIEGPPEEYMLQSGFYCWFLGVPDFEIVCAYIGEIDLGNLEDIMEAEITAMTTRIYKYTLSDISDMAGLIQQSVDWYTRHIVTGESPLPGTQDYSVTCCLDDRVASFGNTQTEVAAERLAVILYRQQALQDLIDVYKKEEKALKAQLKIASAQGFLPTNIAGLTFSIKDHVTVRYDTERMKKDGVYDLYVNSKPGLKFEVRISDADVNAGKLSCIEFKVGGEVRELTLPIFGSLPYTLTQKLGAYAVESSAYGTYEVAYRDCVHPGDIELGVDSFYGLNFVDRVLVMRTDSKPITLDDMGDIVKEFAGRFQERGSTYDKNDLVAGDTSLFK